ncbi:hypothetical protein MKW98_032760 [Papaver atlanticum]|uniref:Uncharacterized protein n=1 Tax=Papaver atlanticum TaxID=357466 RepID=A0AAD4X569_9MAGN|nr:hypothetical protein MKW98_032760 [Papaver atlanticum]
MVRGGGRLPSIMLNKSCILVIVVAGVERFAFKGVASNLVTYLTEVMKMSNSTAAKTVNSWAGISFLLPLFGAFLADSCLDRYSTIFSSSIVYVAGLVALTLTALVWEWIAKTSSCPWSSFPLFLSLFLIALGQGGYNPCLQAFGADQLQLGKNDNQLPTLNNNEDGDANDENISNEKMKSMFFKWWYFGICSGSLLGVSLISYLQDTFGWGLGFAIPSIAMAMSVTPFSCGTRFYTVIDEQPKSVRGSTAPLIKSLVNSIKGAAQKLMHRDYVALPTNLSEADAGELESQQQPLCSQHSGDQQSDNMVNKPNGAVPVVDIVVETKSVVRLMPIWGMLLMFAIIFQQPATFFTKQGMTMKRNIGNHFMIPPATLQSAINVSIILLMPLYDKIVTPVYRIISRSDKGISVMQRMGFGMFLSVIAMSIAAIVETKRLEISRREATMNSVPLCIFWLLPQYILLGISDVFTVVGMQEFFYSEVPNKLKTMGMALHLSVFGVGSFLSAILISFVEFVTSDSNGKHSWFSDDKTEAHLNKYYWLLASSSALSLFFFAIYSQKYYK